MTPIPIVGYRISMAALVQGFKGLLGQSGKNEFRNVLAEFVHSKHLYLTNSGISAFYIILKALQKRSQKKEVILSSYTASTLISAIKKAGLKPVLCDMSLRDFTMDTASLKEIITPETLCVVCDHLFGIPVKNIDTLRNRLPDGTFLIEDCAQAMGSRTGDTLVGSFGDAALFSFNRGKNLPTYGGGCLFTNSDELTVEVERIMHGLTVPGYMYQISLFVKFLLLATAFTPFFYSLLYPLISRMKGESNVTDFDVWHDTAVQAQLGSALFRKFDESCRKRYDNAMTLINGLKNMDGIILPRITEDVRPALNRFPVVFKDIKRRDKVEMKLRDAGIETSRMYIRPLHHQFDLGYKKDDYPNSVYFAEHLLTVPVHPLVTGDHLNTIINTISKA
jgi:perosamine synthetase